MTEEQKTQLEAMQKPSEPWVVWYMHNADPYSMQPFAKDMPREERKRGFAWLNRQCKLNPEMAAKFKILNDETAK